MKTTSLSPCGAVAATLAVIAWKCTQRQTSLALLSGLIQTPTIFPRYSIANSNCYTFEYVRQRMQIYSAVTSNHLTHETCAQATGGEPSHGATGGTAATAAAGRPVSALTRIGDAHVDVYGARST